MPAVDPARGWADAVRLRNGRSVLIRPVHRSDAELVQAFVRGLSVASRYDRFFLALRELSPGLLEHIIAADQQHDVSLVALAAYSDVSVPVVGPAQYGIDGVSNAAEVAVVVGESWRRAGLATRMLLVWPSSRRLTVWSRCRPRSNGTTPLRSGSPPSSRLGSLAGGLAPMSCGFLGRSPQRSRVGELWPRSDAGAADVLNTRGEHESSCRSDPCRPGSK